MFELSFIIKFLIPKRKNLSSSIIGLISTLVIALVVWLVLVFLSVSNGMEKNWTERLIALSAPIQITPTDEYYNSYYYQIDSLSSASNFNSKTLREKLNADKTNPFDQDLDQDITYLFTEPDLNEKGELKDIVKKAFSSINSIKGFSQIEARDYEITVSHSKFRLLRSNSPHKLGIDAEKQNFLTQISYLASFDEKNNKLKNTLSPLSIDDINNVFAMLSLSSDSITNDQPLNDPLLSTKNFQKKLKDFLSSVEITHLKTPPLGYKINEDFLPKKFNLKIITDSTYSYIVIPKEAKNLEKELKSKDSPFLAAYLKKEDGSIFISKDQKNWKKLTTPSLYLASNTQLKSHFLETSIAKSSYTGDLQFYIEDEIQSEPIKGIVKFKDLSIGKVNFINPRHSAFWVHNVSEEIALPESSEFGEPVLLPKTFSSSGVLVGDRGYLSYQATTATSVQEQRIPVFVAGFFDPGLIPTGNKLIITPREITTLIGSNVNIQDPNLGNGINMWFDPYKDADKVKEKLKASFQEKGILKYFEIKTYKEFDFSKDFIEQVRSDKNLFTLIALMIIIVACTNIISMLLLLVNDKKHEIGILRAMGATSKSLSFIFGGCGFLIGICSSLIGITTAYFTLKNIDVLVNLLSAIQGHQAFNPTYFGDMLPSQLNLEALIFVLIVTSVMSFLAGLIPAIKACRLNPANILRSE